MNNISVGDLVYVVGPGKDIENKFIMWLGSMNTFVGKVRKVKEKGMAPHNILISRSGEVTWNKTETFTLDCDVSYCFTFSWLIKIS